MCSESKYYIHLMILQYYFEPLSRVASRGFSKTKYAGQGVVTPGRGKAGPQPRFLCPAAPGKRPILEA